MSDTSSTPSSPISTPPSSIPSPQLDTLSIAEDVSEADKLAATEIKVHTHDYHHVAISYIGEIRPKRMKHSKVSSSLCSRAVSSNPILEHDFPTAAQLYSDAILRNSQEPTLWCNRAYARMKLEEFGYAMWVILHFCETDDSDFVACAMISSDASGYNALS